MRIAMMCAAPGVGLCPYPVQLAAYFKERGYDIHAIRGTDREYETGLGAMLEASGVPVHVIPFTEVMEKAGFNPLDFSLRRALDELKPDIVHSWGPRFAFQGRSFLRRRHRPIHVAMIMSMAHDYRGSIWKERLAAALANRYLDRVLAACELERERLSSIGVRPDKLDVMLAPMACPPNLKLADESRAAGRDAVLREFGLRTDRLHVGCFAQFRPVKRQDMLIRAFGELAEEFGQWDLVLAGAGERFEACKEVAKALPGRVHFLGSIPHERSIRLMTVMDAVAHSSSIETYGFSLLEPLLLGVPTVMTRVGVAGEIEQAGKAIVVPPDDQSALREGLRKVLRRDDAILGMAAQGPKWVTETVDTPLVATKLLALYERLLQARSAGGA